VDLIIFKYRNLHLSPTLISGSSDDSKISLLRTIIAIDENVRIFNSFILISDVLKLIKELNNHNFFRVIQLVLIYGAPSMLTTIFHLIMNSDF